MHDAAVKNRPYDGRKAHSQPAFPSAIHDAQPYFDHGGNTIFRKTSCTCGGGCPSCQTKSAGLRVSHPSDAAEIEADRIADKVMRMPDSSALGRAGRGSGVSKSRPGVRENIREAGEQEAISDRLEVRRFAAGAADGGAGVSRDFLNSLGEGAPLDFQTRTFFEPRFGVDFARVRIHTGEKAARSAGDLSSLAYTVGNHIVFNKNRYRPETETGKSLLAHELTHTIQKTGQINRQEGPRDAGVHPAGVPMPERPPAGGMGDVRLAEARMEEEARQKALFFDRLRALSPTTDPAIRAEMEARFPANTDDRWLAETILRSGPEPRWSLVDLTERQRRAANNFWPAEPGNIGAVLGSGSHTVQAFYFRGTSDRRALIIGGVHGSEPGGVEVVHDLLDIMRRPNAPMPFFSVIIVPELFSRNVHATRPLAERRASGGTVRARTGSGTASTPDPNRQFPAVGSDPVTDPTLGCVVDEQQRCVEPENLVLLDLINRFQPERVANVHGHSISHDPAVLLGEGGPSITTDPRPGHETEDDALALSMATEAQRLGVRIPANFMGTPNQRTRYPTGTAPRMSAGITFGQWGSHATPTRPAMNVILIETFGNTTSTTGREAGRAARRTELMNLAQILRDFFLAP